MRRARRRARWRARVRAHTCLPAVREYGSRYSRARIALHRAERHRVRVCVCVCVADCARKLFGAVTAMHVHVQKGVGYRGAVCVRVWVRATRAQSPYMHVRCDESMCDLCERV